MESAKSRVSPACAARSLTCRDDLDSKWRLLLAENELSCVSLQVFNYYRKLTIPAFFLGVSASEESIKVAEIASVFDRKFTLKFDFVSRNRNFSK